MPQSRVHQAVDPNRRDDIIAQVLDDMNSMPLARAAVQASELYSEKGLENVTDPLLRIALCRALAHHFEGSNASALSYWKTFQ